MYENEAVEEEEEEQEEELTIRHNSDGERIHHGVREGERQKEFLQVSPLFLGNNRGNWAARYCFKS